MEFRLVHDNKKVINVIETDGGNRTYTKNELEIFDSKEDMEDRINELGLEYEPEEEI